jgi:hypothetical protein
VVDGNVRVIQVILNTLVDIQKKTGQSFCKDHITDVPRRTKMI